MSRQHNLKHRCIPLARRQSLIDGLVRLLRRHVRGSTGSDPANGSELKAQRSGPRKKPFTGSGPVDSAATVDSHAKGDTSKYWLMRSSKPNYGSYPLFLFRRAIPLQPGSSRCFPSTSGGLSTPGNTPLIRESSSATPRRRHPGNGGAGTAVKPVAFSMICSQ